MRSTARSTAILILALLMATTLYVSYALSAGNEQRDPNAPAATTADAAETCTIALADVMAGAADNDVGSRTDETVAQLIADAQAACDQQETDRAAALIEQARGLLATE